MAIEPNASSAPCTPEQLDLFLRAREYRADDAGKYQCPKCGARTAHIVDGGYSHALVCGNGTTGCGFLGSVYELEQRFTWPGITRDEPAPEAVATLDKLQPSSGAEIPVQTFTVHEADDIVQSELEVAQYRVPGLVADGVISALGGFIGFGKTPFTVRMLKAGLAGESFIDIDVPEFPDDYTILYLTQESLNTFQPLLIGAGITPEISRGRLKVAYAHEVFKSGMRWDQVCAMAAETIGGKGLFVVDTFRTFARLKNERDDSEVTEHMRPLVQAVGTGMSAWTVMHSWKGFKDIPDEDADVMHIAGGGALSADAGIIAVYKKPRSEGGNENVRYFKVVRNRFGNDLEPRYVELEHNELRVVGHLSHAARAQVADMRKVEEAIQLHPGKTKTELQVHLGLAQQRLSDAMNALEGEARIHGIGTPRSRTNPVRWYPGTRADDDIPSLPDDVPMTAPMNTKAVWHDV